MKNRLWLVALALAAALGAFALTRHCASRCAPDEMAWLRDEFRLTPAQAAAIEKLNADYAPVCADHCARIAKTRRHLQTLSSSPSATPAELAAAQAAWQAVCDECTTATRAHLETVAAQMSPEQGRRYLELVGPKLTRRDPGKPFGLR